jgi:hypothetical protein
MDIKFNKKIFKYYILVIVFIFFGLNKTFSQNNFSLGYNNGFKAGYCYNKGVGCIAPIPPITPIPNLNESLYNFQDGYNRGFIDGRGDANNIQTENQSPYGRAAYRPDIKPFVPDYNSFHNALKNRSLDLEETKRKQDIINDFIQKWNVKYNSKNNAASLEHANLIRNYHKYLTQSNSLPAPRKDAPPEMVSDDIFLTIRYPSSEVNSISNDMGTQVYSAKAYFSFNIKFNTYEIFNISINDDGYEYEKNIFKKNHEWEYENRIAKLNNEFPCPTSSYFTGPMLISTDGKVIGEYQTLRLKEVCINALGQYNTSYPIELYFIKDLEKFIKK